MPKRAYYYLWWSREHWHEKLGPHFPYKHSPLPLPATLDPAGCHAHTRYSGNTLTDVPHQLYSQDQRSVIERHVRQAHAARLQGFIANWRGTGSLTQGIHATTYTPRLVTLLDEAHQSTAAGRPFDVWLSYKAADSLLPAGYIIRDLRWLHASARRPLRVGPAWRPTRRDLVGQPPLPARNAQAGIEGCARAVLPGRRREPDVHLRRPAPCVRRPHLLLVEPEPVREPRLVHTGATPRREVHAAHKPWFAPFAPGYQHQLEGGTCVPRRHGDTLQRLYNGNRKSNPEAMCLISWNEITEGTYIEPLRRYGDGYVKTHRATLTVTRPSDRRRCRTSRPSGRCARPDRRSCGTGSAAYARRPGTFGAPRDRRDRSSWRPSSTETCILSLSIPSRSCLEGWQRGAAGS